ncbi:flagellar basal body rod protein FlgC [Sagittula sp. NFXS13]|uniref:Flagellar basal-body rod protein FlgC n=1 Tax=Sagittula marina TaxID=943940 RepID=A0A7W6DLM9_9RHOB|nr:flagellar basal body rod protein FlgC [Sagittula marina]MBB3983711.1 flagellar basal-body rod protein FlgC [Sagittula marina]
MSAFSDALSVTTGGLKSQAARLRVVSENIANVDTPGYRRKTMSFDMQRNDGGLSTVAPGDVNLSRTELPDIYDPDHPLADATGNYKGSSVDLMIEIADAREAQRSYEANLKMFDQTRQMSTSLMDLLRR